MNTIATIHEPATTAQPSFFDGQIAPLSEFSAVSQEAQPPLNVVLLYQDAVTQEWAWEQSCRMTSLKGDRKVSCRGWKMSELTEPHVFSEAVAAALQAELLVLAAHAGKDLPLGFYAWTEAWLPYRCVPAGNLILVLGLSPQAAPVSCQLREHLHALASKAHMAFSVAQQVYTRESPAPYPGSLHKMQRPRLRQFFD